MQSEPAKQYLPDHELRWLGIDIKTLVVGMDGRRVKFLCDYCGNETSSPSAWFKRTKTHFCSEQCHSLFQRNAEKKTCKICGDIFMVRPCEAKKYSTCQKPECRTANKKGKNNPNYRHGKAYTGGRRPTDKRYKEWREAVFKRDNHTCQMCGKRGGTLNADHIRPWAYFETLRYEVANGRTLCVPCHKSTYKDLRKWRDEVMHLGVDLDGTLAKTHYPDFTLDEPMPGALEAVEHLNKEGWKITIYTARPWSDYQKIEDWCTKYNIPVRRIICGKPLFKYVIDDRNIAFHGSWQDVLNTII